MKQSYSGSVRPITRLDIDSRFSFELVRADGTSFLLLLEARQSARLKADLWEGFRFRGRLISEGVLEVHGIEKQSDLFSGPA